VIVGVFPAPYFLIRGWWGTCGVSQWRYDGGLGRVQLPGQGRSHLGGIGRVASGRFRPAQVASRDGKGWAWFSAGDVGISRLFQGGERIEGARGGGPTGEFGIQPGGTVPVPCYAGAARGLYLGSPGVVFARWGRGGQPGTGVSPVAGHYPPPPPPFPCGAGAPPPPPHWWQQKQPPAPTCA
jgi:hypothetical protein